jgi:hypothetical protein
MTGENPQLERWLHAFTHTPFGCLLRLFLSRMFHGGGDGGAEQLGLGVGAVLLLSAMPGLLVSLLMFEKYGSLIRFLRGDGVYDPFTAAIPDEYFFIVLSTAVTAGVALWQWDSIFLDRRDHANLLALPISLRTIFFANLSAVLLVAGAFAIVINAASFLLFPVAVVGSQASIAVFLRFTFGHGVAVIFASVFSFLTVFTVVGLLMAMLPAFIFRRVSLLVRFLLAIGLVALVATVFAVPDLLMHMPVGAAQRLSRLPPMSVLALVRWVWVAGNDQVAADIARLALASFGWTAVLGLAAYTFSFQRAFLRIPETADAGALPRVRVPLLHSTPIHKVMLRNHSQRACYQFIAKTLLRSDAHLQVVSAFAAVALVAAAEAVNSIHADHFFPARHAPSADFLAIPFTLSYCIIVGIRCAFEIPAQLEANWIFRFWLPPDDHQPRSVARCILLAFTLPWVVPATFIATTWLFDWRTAALHSAIVIVAIVLAVEILLVRYRKLPFTCSPPSFQSHAGLILVAYLFSFFVFTDYLPDLEAWSLAEPARTLILLPLFGIAFSALRGYRGQILDMDKQLIFEDASTSAF